MKNFKIFILLLAFLMIGCSTSSSNSSSDSSGSSASLSYTTDGGSSTITFNTGTLVILIDQNYDPVQSEIITDYDYCNDSNGTCTTYSSAQDAMGGNSIDTVLNSISDDTTSITVPFELDANDLIFQISSSGGCGLYLGMNSCD